jgi:hypothetical protein
MVDRIRTFLYCHLYSDQSKGVFKTIKINLDSLSTTILDLKLKIIKALKDNLKDPQASLYKISSISKTASSSDLSDGVKLNQYFDNKDDIFCKIYVQVEPIGNSTNLTSQVEDTVLTYKTINEYSFYVANKQVVRVIVPVPGIEKVLPENIISNFTETSLEVKVKNALNGINYRFAVPRLDAKIIPEKSEAFVKDGKLNIRLRKAKEDDHWSYLFKQRYVGE